MTEKRKRRWFPRWRKMTWALLAWTGLIVVWIVSASSGSGESVEECMADGFLTRDECQDAVDAGTGIGVFLILVLWALVFTVLALVWFMSRPRTDSTAELAREMRLARETREREEASSRDSG